MRASPTVNTPPRTATSSLTGSPAAGRRHGVRHAAVDRPRPSCAGCQGRQLLHLHGTWHLLLHTNGGTPFPADKRGLRPRPCPPPPRRRCALAAEGLQRLAGCREPLDVVRAIEKAVGIPDMPPTKQAPRRGTGPQHLLIRGGVSRQQTRIRRATARFRASHSGPVVSADPGRPSWTSTPNLIDRSRTTERPPGAESRARTAPLPWRIPAFSPAMERRSGPRNCW